MNTPRISGIQTVEQTYAANSPVLRVSYSKAPRSGEVMTSRPAGATITADSTGGAGSKLRVTITETLLDMAGTETTSVTNIDGSVVETLKGLVDALNDVDGIIAWVTDAPHSLSVDSDTWTALSATNIPEAPAYLDCLKRSVVTSHPVYKRIGMPTERDSNELALVRLECAIDSETGGSVEVGTDDYHDGYTAHRNDLLTDAANDILEHSEADRASTYRGPLLVTVAATDLTGTKVRIGTQNRAY